MKRSPFCVLVVLFALLVMPSPAGAATARDAATDRAEGNNPTIAQKFLGYDAWVRTHRTAPDVLLLGSSRTVMLDPVQVQRISGHSTYNAGITSAAARELLATASFADLRGAGPRPHLVVMLDIEAFDNRRPTARVLDYQRRLDTARDACAKRTQCGRTWVAAARRIVADAIARQRHASRDYRTTQRADGRQVNGMLAQLEAQGRDLDAMRRERIATRVGSYRAGGFDHLYPAPRAAFERMLQTANATGDVPFIALTAMHPDCIRICGAAGWSARRQEVIALLDELAARYEFDYVDLSQPATWGGSGGDFYDEIHLRPEGAAKVVRHLESLGAFEHQRPAGNTSMS